MKFAPKNTSLYLLAYLLVSSVYAAPPAGGPPPPTPPPPPGLPINNGLTILLVLAIFLGYYSLKRKKLNLK